MWPAPKFLKMAESGLDESSIVDKVSQAYSADPDDTRKDVHAFFNDLRKHEILR
jgi:hypothetical protein